MFPAKARRVVLMHGWQITQKVKLVNLILISNLNLKTVTAVCLPLPSHIYIFFCGPKKSLLYITISYIPTVIIGGPINTVILWQMNVVFKIPKTYQ